MSVLVRRFIIITLICVNFAIAFGAIVGKDGTRTRRPDVDFSDRCTSATPLCGDVS